MYLFLDFDGVLHKKRGPQNELFNKIDLLNDLLTSCPDLKIILSTSHRNNPNMIAYFKSLLLKEHKNKIKEKLEYCNNDFSVGARLRLINNYLKNKGLDLDCNWIAIDDKIDLFYPITKDHPRYSNLIICDETIGITKEQVENIKNLYLNLNININKDKNLKI